MASKPTAQRKPIELSRKAEILSEVRAGKLTITEIARKFRIAKSTLTGIIKDGARVTAALNDGDFTSKRKKMRTAAHKSLEDVHLAWIQCARSANLPVNGIVLKAKVEEIALKMDIEFACSDGWLDRFRKRHELVFRSVAGEAAAVDEVTCNDWRLTKLKQILQDYDLGDVYNVDETALFYQLLPQ
ncbi:tigger transposable element-derived protein 4-like [Rhipicephalus sanguineus]|uniref:tigger transposable element-derived protein 4-like n=1 Tax=Rhipicephalus sanguineus TaxID=34632 RepID=UPI001895B1EE|nr:tigger transposable element-derived protein 4-like [Rhipicephalus sanguineus]